MDWIAYSADHQSDAALEAELPWADSENNCSEDDWNCNGDAVGAAVLMGDDAVSGGSTRPIIDPEMLASMLRDCLLQPFLSTIPNPKDVTSDENTLPVTPPSCSLPQELELMVNPLCEEFFDPLWLPHETSPVKVRIPNDYLSSQHGGCDACGELGVSKVIRLIPCGHIICSLCFTTSLSAVSVVHGSSKCTACMEEVSSFRPFNNIRQAPRDKGHSDIQQSQSTASRSMAANDGNVVMRIDNVAWDITPAIVKAFLPRDSLVSSPVPIHILLDRFDGRTKDYMYIEVISQEAARKIMKTRQNTFMAGGALTGGRKRPVTISPVSHAELISELRPRSAVELNGLLSLCQAAVSTPPITNPALSEMTSFVAPNGVAHFVKSRHGPFYALMSILSKLRGKQSPAYWDVFHVASGAIAALANSISRYSTKTLHTTSLTEDPTDEDILERLADLFQFTFQLRPDRGT
ncbi:hypothetical protein BCR39DRAFT_586218 [Naematelia encephala]|uniref:RING-type domain-containing protein n=1 Tax=Naematelia encephala TaxID=71784 RepID=A0A1Y2BGT3_9TREE|nr:hypothetical protein BCR39DRAFT_586218 [Naematelia encephala]